jgi:cell division protein FtsL
MARTNTRKIARRAVKKKNPLPAIMIVLYMAGLSLAYVSLYMGNSKLRFDLEDKESQVVESQNHLRNLAAKVEEKTNKVFIVAKIKQLGMRLDQSIEGQVINVRHFEPISDLKPHKLREGSDEDPETLTRND